MENNNGWQGNSKPGKTATCSTSDEAEMQFKIQNRHDSHIL